MRPLFGGPRAWFEVVVAGWERLPPPPVLVVGNHSGGTTVPDVWGLFSAWYGRFGPSRPIHALGHEMVFALDPVGRFFARMGVLRAGPDVARRVLGELGRDLVVFPGGDLDAWRPHRDRFRVRFAGRTGYARLAIEAGVPVVPVAHAGAHDSLVVLTDGRPAARALRFPDLFRAHILPVHLSLPYGVGVGPLPHPPPPGTLRYRFAEPIPPPAWSGDGPPPAAQVDALDRACRAALQRELDALRQEEPTLRERARHLARRLAGRAGAAAAK